MPTADEEFAATMRKAVAGSEDAVKALFTEYETQIIRAVRRRMDRRMRPQFDSLDFAQDVWASFFAEPVEKRTFNSSDELLSYLTTMAQNKVIDAVRQRLQRRKYDLHRERSLDDSRTVEKENLPGHQTTPSQAMSAEEEWRAYLARQPLVYRRIMILLRQGVPHKGIAQDIGIDVRTVYRVADKLLADWIL